MGERGQKFRKKVVMSFMDGPSVVGTNDLWIHYRSLPFPHIQVQDECFLS